MTESREGKSQGAGMATVRSTVLVAQRDLLYHTFEHRANRDVRPRLDDAEGTEHGKEKEGTRERKMEKGRHDQTDEVRLEISRWGVGRA